MHASTIHLPIPLPPPEMYSDELLQLLGVLMPAAEEGSWALQWLWDWLYQASGWVG